MNIEERIEAAMQAAETASEEDLNSNLKSIETQFESIQESIDSIVFDQRAHVRGQMSEIIYDLQTANEELQVQNKDLYATCESLQEKLDDKVTIIGGQKEVGFVIGAIFTSMVWAAVLWYINS